MTSIDLETVKQILADAGMPSFPQFDLPAAFAATSALEAPHVEGKSVNPNAVGDVALGGSYGGWQVFSKEHPELAAAVKKIMALGLEPSESMRRQAVALAPLFRETAKEAIQVAQVLQSRGFEVSGGLMAGIIDAIWQNGPGPVLRWARKTTTAALEEIHARAKRYLELYNELAGAPLAIAKWGALAFFLSLAGFLAWALSD